MHIRRVRAEESAIRRYLDACWLPYQEELSTIRTDHSLTDDASERALEFHTDQLDTPSGRLWVALDDVDNPTAPLPETGATFAGFIRTQFSPSPQRFDWSDRVEMADCWVREGYRGSGLADDLLRRAAQHAREDGCADLTLTVGTENQRALGYFESRGFEPQGYGMVVPLAAVSLGGEAGVADGPQFRRVRSDEDTMCWFVDECWLPFWRDMGEAVGEAHLSPTLDREELVDSLVDAYDTPDRRCWVALDEVDDATRPLDEIDAVCAGWINAGLEPTDPFLASQSRLFIGNLYTDPDYRGTGLTDRLVERARQYAREEGCDEFSLRVEEGNDRAMAYYDKLGFERFEQRMAVPVDSLAL